MNQEDGLDLIARLEEMFQQYGLTSLLGPLRLPDEFENPQLLWHGYLERLVDALEERLVFAPTLLMETMEHLDARSFTFIADVPREPPLLPWDVGPEKVRFSRDDLAELRRSAETATKVISGLRTLIRE